jgi:chemotaxis protein MotA
MIGIAGVVCVFVMVFGGYLMAGGKLDVILKSLPYEMAMIGGAAVGAFILANGAAISQQALKAIPKAFGGKHWSSVDNEALLGTVRALIELYREDPVSLEAHLDDPHSSEIFSSNKKLLEDGALVGLVCDALRAMLMNYNAPDELEELLTGRVEDIIEHDEHPGHALQAMADGLPALGIVAAVLGVIKTMSSIDQPPEILGALIGGALVGTFLGVFLAYGLVGPVATRLLSIARHEGTRYHIVSNALLAAVRGHPAQMCVEVGRQAATALLRPGPIDP